MTNIDTIREAHGFPEDSIDYLWHRANIVGEVNTLNMLEYVSRLEAALDQLVAESKPQEQAMTVLEIVKKILIDNSCAGVPCYDCPAEMSGLNCAAGKGANGAWHQVKGLSAEAHLWFENYIKSHSKASKKQERSKP